MMTKSNSQILYFYYIYYHHHYHCHYFHHHYYLYDFIFEIPDLYDFGLGFISSLPQFI
jgi:hypothetical protein